MSNIFRIAMFSCLLQSSPISAQYDTTHRYGAYFFDGEDVVFEFDRRVYEKAIRSSDSLKVDFADLRIKKVSVAGNFNEWSGEGWRMKHIDENRFQLRKSVKMFTDAPNWQFRFIINGAYWTPPDSVLIKQGLLGWYNIQNPNMNGPVPSDTGNVLFKLAGFTTRKKVILTGSFNNWNEQALEMKKNETGWELRIPLRPGIYEYKFIADGQWMEDPANPEKLVNQYSTFNSVLRVNEPVIFELKGFLQAQKVILAGSFNDWNTEAIHMQKTATGWKTTLPLIGGKHLYKFIVDGKWLTDPENPRIEEDDKGNLNSVLFVQ